MKNKIITLVLFTLLLTACGLGLSISTDAETVTNTTAEITKLDLPDGYYPDFSSTLKGYQAVAYTRGDGPSHIYLIQSENEEDGKNLNQILDQIIVGSGDPETNMTVVEKSSVTVRGEECTLVISDATNSEGVTYRQAVVSFSGNGGPAMLVFSESLNNWDDATMTALVNSLH